MNDENKIVGPGNSVNTINNSEVQIIDDEQSNILEPVVEEVKEETTALEYEQSLQGFYKYLTTRDTLDLVMVLVRMLIILAIIVIFKFVFFDIIRDMGYSIFDLSGIEVNDVIHKVWNFLVEMTYYVLAILAFVKIISTRYDNLLKKKIDKV